MIRQSISLTVLAAMALTILGCGSSNSSVTPAQPQTSNHYAGLTAWTTLAQLGGSGPTPFFDVWIYTLNTETTTQYYSYGPATIDQNVKGYGSGVTSTTGIYQPAGGFLNLGINPDNSTRNGYALEIPGRAAMSRLGILETPMAFWVASNACPPDRQDATFQFVTSATSNSDVPGPFAYGSAQISISGNNWSFSRVNAFAIDGSPAASPSLTTAVCSSTLEGYVATVAPNQTNSTPPLIAAIGPSGFFGMALGGSQTGSGLYPGQVGVVQPTSPLNTSDLASAKYLGFESTPVFYDKSGTVTQLVSFGAGSGSTLSGGEFPNDDPTQSAVTDTMIDFGAQDGQNNGLYKSVVVTVPDTTLNCVGQAFGGTDSKGNPTCIFPGVAVAGNPESKYAIYVIANDLRGPLVNGAPATLGIYLFQQ